MAQKTITLKNTDTDIKLLVTNLIRQNINVQGGMDFRLYGSKGPEGEGHYLRIQHIKTWDKSKMNAVQAAIDETNLASKECTFKITGFDDYEKESNWPTDFNFICIKK
jgi:hypothetical protein